MLRSHQFTRIQRFPANSARRCNFNTSPQLSRKFVKSFISHNFLPSATPRAEILPCGHGADTSRVLIRCKQLEWLHQTWILNTAHVHTEDSEIDLASIFYNFPQGVRGPFYIES